MTTNEDLWAARLPNGDIRSGTLEQLNEAFRAGHLSEHTLVYGSTTDSWIPLADALAANVGPMPAAAAVPRASVPAPSAAPPAVSAGSEIWQVKLASGEVRSGTREQLTEALEAGHLHEDVLVLGAGARDWVRLGSVMGRNAVPVVIPSVQPSRSAAPQPVAPQPVAPRSVAPAPVSVAPSAATPVLPEGSDALWQVRLADGQVRSGTRQQLEEAFHAGHLDVAALVLAAGAREWVTLAQMMAPEPVEAPPAPAVAAPEPPPVVAAEEAAAAPAALATEEATAPPAAVAAEEAPAASAPEAATPPQTDEGQPDLQASWDGDQVWRVTLSGKQLKRAFHEGLLDDDAMVLAVGTEEWLRLGDVRRTPSDPTVMPPVHSGQDATPATNGATAEADAPGA